MMTSDERAQILVTARLLEAASKIELLSTGITLIALVSIVFVAPSIPAIAAVVLGLVAKVYSVRVAFDARLFDDIATERITIEDLNTAFPHKAGRSWTDRCRGATRLVNLCAAATFAQSVAMLVMGFARG